MKIISIINHKGGVGKTTSTLNLGKALSILKKKVLLIDLDPQANLSLICSTHLDKKSQTITESIVDEKPLKPVKVSENMDVVVSELDLAFAEAKISGKLDSFFKLDKAIKKLNAKYDYILIDCPPSVGILTSNAIIASTDILIPVQAQFLAANGLGEIINLIQEVDSNLGKKTNILGILMTQTRHTVMSKASVETVTNKHKSKVFKTHIRENVTLQESSALRQDIFTYNKASNGAEDYLSLANEILSI
ncbi:hypothetical protein AD998_21550 [bacterium 336/3]|jgi:chromosome partitioning protein|nr:hypothetical protein AD998_21550 [bacterium 336/3]